MSLAEDVEKALALRKLPLQEQFPFATIGEGSYGGLSVHRWDDKTKLTIGAYCSFGHEVKILMGGLHRVDWATTFPFSHLWDEAKHIEGHPATRGDITIGSDVWIGSEAMILSGVSIGHGAVVGARSVVTKNVRPYEIVVGHPAEHLRWRFDGVVIERLLASEWWTWHRDRIARALPYLLQPDVRDFLNRVEEGSL